MVGALWTGISGLQGQQTALNNESNNIANVNTIGFKAARISFADQMYQSKIGKGVQVTDAEKMYSQGNLKLTGVNYDMALSEDGFFSVAKKGSTNDIYYTRAGNFRMGQSGTLQDPLGNEVQGWPMTSPPETESTDPNVDKFTDAYSKLIASSVIQYNTSIQTITARATDYTITATTDSDKVFNGYGLKTQYSKVSDIEELIKAYTTALNNLKSNPNGTSSSAKMQISYIDYEDQGGTDAISADGDEVYIYIDGNKISQSYITDSSTATSYRKTMKAFADKISKMAGIKAYVADSSYSPSTADSDVDKGILRIESLIPGKTFKITSGGMVHAGNDKPASYDVIQQAEEGSGIGAVDSIKNELKKAITGKQTDVYTEDDLDSPDGTTDYTYYISIYDKGLEKVVNVPDDSNDDPAPITITTPSSIDDFVTAINGDTNLDDYIKAYNVNGNLVIRTLDSNFDVEYSGYIQKQSTPVQDLKRNSDYSNREGAGAEFMEIKTLIDQTSSKGSLQLRLDLLSISTNTFGDFEVDDKGIITIVQDGARYAVGQVAIAKFVSNRGLEPIGNNLLKATLESGDPIYNINNSKMADIKAQTLELSTADLSESLVNLMVYQRAFEANAKSITTADTILNTLINLKR